MSLRNCLTLLLPLALSSAVEEPTFHAAEGTELVRTFTSEVHVELDDMSVTLNGDDHTFGDYEISSEGTYTRVVADVYGPLGEGRPQRLVRTYRTLEGDEVESATTPGGEGGSEETSSSNDLEGRSVVFEWDEEEYALAFDDDGEEDDDLLEGLVEDMDLRAFLPGEAVDEGDSWEIDAAAFALINTPGGVVLSADDSEDPEGDRELDDALDEGLDGELTATFKGTRDEDGREVAVIELSAQIESEADQDVDRDGGEALLTVSVAWDMEGELLWDMEGGHLASLELTGTVEYRHVEVSAFAAPNGEEYEVVQTMVLSGEERIEATVERE